MIKWKGIITYLAITFVLTYGLWFGFILSGFGLQGANAYVLQLAVLGGMWIPALATVITCKWIIHEPLMDTGLHFGGWRFYLYSWIAIPIVFAMIYLVTWGLGLTEPDWILKGFYSTLIPLMPPGTTFPAPGTFLGIAFVASLFASPWINSLAGFGEEWGWRGFLLPRLLPLGKWKAYLLVGIIWGLWHAPLVVAGFNYPGYPLLGILLMCGFTFSSGIFINELSLKYRSAVLAGWIHGLINSQGYGIWRLLFFNTNPILGGMAGLVGMIGWIALGVWSAHWSDPASK